MSDPAMLSPVYSEEDGSWYVVDRGIWFEFATSEEAWAWIERQQPKPAIMSWDGQ